MHVFIIEDADRTHGGLEVKAHSSSDAIFRLDSNMDRRDPMSGVRDRDHTRQVEVGGAGQAGNARRVTDLLSDTGRLVPGPPILKASEDLNIST